MKHCVKRVRYRSLSGPYFPAFELNTEKCCVSLRIQSKYEKIRTRKIPSTDTFHAVKWFKNIHFVIEWNGRMKKSDLPNLVPCPPANRRTPTELWEISVNPSSHHFCFRSSDTELFLATMCSGTHSIKSSFLTYQKTNTKN